MMADLRIRLDITSLYNNIKPGDITHEDTGSKFNEYFQKFSRRMKTYVQLSHQSVLQQLPCFVLQIAYDYCQQCILSGPLMNNFCDNVQNYIIPDELQQLNIYKKLDNKNTFKPKESFDKLFELDSVTIDDELWELLKAGYGAFIHISEAKSSHNDTFSSTLINKTLDSLPEGIPLTEDRIKDMVKEAVTLSWNILTLVPPALLYQPTHYKEEWHEKRITSWNKELPSSDPVVYFRPILLYSALGHVGCKGAIGNTQSKDMKILQCQYCPNSTTDGNVEKQQSIEYIEDIQIRSVDGESERLQDQSFLNDLTLGRGPTAEKENNNSQLEGRICSTSIDDNYMRLLTHNMPQYGNDKEYNISTQDEQRLSLFMENYFQSYEQNEEEKYKADSSTLSHHSNSSLQLNEIQQNEENSTDIPMTNIYNQPNDSVNIKECIVTTDNNSTPTTSSSSPTHSSNIDTIHPIIATTGNQSIEDQLTTWKGNSLLLQKVANLCHDIKVGDVTHEDVRVAFNEYFVTFNRRAKVFVRYNGTLQQLPCAVLQVAYDICVQYMLNGSMMNSFLTSTEYNQLPDIIKELFINKETENGVLNISNIFNYTNDLERREDDWTTLKISYSCLLHVSNVKSLQPFTELNNKVLSVLPHWNGDSFQDMIEKAVHVTWNMMSLVPPPLLVQPLIINEEWHEKRTTYWNDDLMDPYSPIYFQPVMFYSVLKQVATKGIIGNYCPYDSMNILSCDDNGEEKLYIKEHTIENTENKTVSDIITAGIASEDSGGFNNDNINENSDITTSETSSEVINNGASIMYEEEASGIAATTSEANGDVVANVITCFDNNNDTIINSDSMSGMKRHVLYHDFDAIWRPCHQCNNYDLRSNDSSLCEQCRKINKLPSFNTPKYKSPEYISLSILTLLCCFPPVSIIALVKSLQTRKYNKEGQCTKAKISSQKARKYNMISLTIGSIIIITCLIAVLVILVYIATVSYF